MEWMDNDKYNYDNNNSVRCQAHEEKGRNDSYISES